MKEPLYNLKRNQRVKIEGLRIGGKLVEELNFHHIDGMYSYCTDDNDNVFHLRADTLVTVIGKLK